MIPLYVFVLLTTPLGDAVQEDIVFLERIKSVHVGDNITLTCSFPSIDASVTAWFKQSPEEKPLLIASAFRSTQIKFHNGFNNSGRFIVLREQRRIILNILHAEPSDTAMYYCSVVEYSKLALGACTVLVLKGTPAILQHPISGPVELGGDTTLQCSVLTDTSAGERSVYWFRAGSGESHPGIIYTHGNRSDECKKSSETDSSTQSCVYKFPKRNLSLSDAGTYYCAVAACGEIVFGSGTKLDFVENSVLDPTIIVLAATNLISVVVIFLLCRKLHNSHHIDAPEGHTVQVNQTEETDALNYAALSFIQSSSSRRSRTKTSSDQPVYSQINTRQ